MTSCNVVEICKAVGMKAVCDGPYDDCGGSHPDVCYVTPYSGDGKLGCNVALKGLPGCGGRNIEEAKIF